MAVVTVVNRRVSAVETSAPNAARDAQQIRRVALRVRLRDHRAADQRRRAEPDDRDDQRRTAATDDTAQDIERRT